MVNITVYGESKGLWYI